MSAVRQIQVAADEADLRVDRWFKRHFPHLAHGRLEKLLRKGQIRVDGGRVKSNHRLAVGQTVRVPPLDVDMARPATPRRYDVDPHDVKIIRQRVLYQDDWILAIDKPAGLAVQGGTGTKRHLDAMLDHLKFGAKDRPRLVHRLDKDTSGVLVLGRSAQAAAWLTQAFRRRETRKLYWAVVVGVAKPLEGVIDAPLIKMSGHKGERVEVHPVMGQRAVTLYRTVEHTSRQASWLALEPRTGRTHQLRVHCTHLGVPVVGDGKYGGPAAFSLGAGFGKGLHLHARALQVPLPNGEVATITAPLPAHMRETWDFLGIDRRAETADDFFDDPD